MVFLDSPKYIRPGEAVAAVHGWYAGEVPCRSVSIQMGQEAIPLLAHARPDVRDSYPHLHTEGFRGVLDFLNLSFEQHYRRAAGESVLRAEIVVNESLIFPIEIGADPDWFLEMTRRKAMIEKGFYANGLPKSTQAESLGLGLAPGTNHYRSYVGLSEHYDLSSAGAFFLLVSLGLRQHHTLLDIGCGSLRCGRLLIPYLNAGNYLGIEPNAWLVEAGLQSELGCGILDTKAPRFLFSADPAVLEGCGPIDFALANSIFSHASKPQIAGWLAEVSKILSAGGALVATFVSGTEDNPRQEWAYPECVSYQNSTMRQLAEAAGLSLTILDWKHLHAQTWGLFAKSKFDFGRISESPAWNALAKSVI